MWELPRNPFSGTVRTPPNAAPSIRLRRIQVEQRYDERCFGHQQERVSVLTLKRRTHVAVFLITLCQYAMLDTLNILPIGILTWCCSFTVALEFVMTTSQTQQLQNEDYVRQQELFYKQYERALFEYQVLNQSKKKIVIIKEDNGRRVLVAL